MLHKIKSIALIALTAVGLCKVASADSTSVAKSTTQTLIPGQPAPDFKLPSQDGNLVSLKDFRGKWIVLYFYPKDFTGGCTLEAHNFQRDLALYDSANAVILGVSVDAVDSHKEFCTKEGLNFKLLADTNKTVSATYNSLHNILGKKFAARNTFIIDPNGILRQAFMGVKPADHSKEVLAALAGFQKK